MSGPKLFRQLYTVRHFKGQEIIGGYAHSLYEDFQVPLNVQPMSPDEVSKNPEGERRKKMLKAFGDYTFTAADQTKNQRGDWLLYKGVWYECTSALDWSHTILQHNKAEFAEVAAAETCDSIVEEIKSDERGDFYGFK